MTEQSKKKEEAKKEIRSLLLSAPLGLTVTELKRDFVEFIGRPLPWKELGYSNPEDFLQDIPDTVKVTYASTGMVLTGVANNSTKHIEKMVQCQKIDSKVKKKVMDRRIRQSRPILGNGGGYPGAGGWAGHRNIRPNFSNTRYPYYNSNQNLPPRMQYHQANQRQRARHMAPPPSVPAYVRGQISQLVSQHPQGLPLTHFCSIFRSRFGVPLDFREMGFSSEQDLLASLRDVIGMRTLAGGETRVMSVQACLAWDHDRWRGDTQTTSTPVSDRKRPLLPLNGPVSEPRPLTSAGKSSQTQRQVPSHGKGRGRGALKREVTTAVGWSAGRLSECEQVSPRDEEEKRRSNSDSLMKMEQNCNIPMTIQNEIKQIMSKRPKGVCASRLPIEYKELFRKILPMKTYGYNSVIEFVSDLPHIIRIERPHPQGDWHLFPVNVADASKPKLEKLEMPSSSATAFSSSTSVCTPSPPPLEVDKALRESVAQVMSISPDGIPLDKFQETYQAVTGKSLNVARYGPGGLKRILHSMSDILIISLDASDKAVVLPKMHSAPRSFDQLQVQFQPIVGSNAEDVSDSILHLPNDAVSPGCTYRPQPLPPSSADGGDYIELYVSNVISPDMFWIQLRGRKTTLALEDLMDELEAVYSNKNLPKEYNMPPVLAQKGMLCAVIYPQDSFWHRGFIMGFKDKLYQVYYVDYGNTCYVSIDQMRLLKSKFLKLPAQAIRARLGHIKPIGGMWQSNSTDRMLTLAREKPLVGLVVAKKDRVLSLCLTDTSKEEDIHFNDVFVDEGYAVFEPDGGALTPQVHEQAPSSTLLYGEATHDDGDGETTQDVVQRYVRQAQMMDDVTMNLVNLHGQLYLTSGQISSLFFQHDVISTKLRQDNVDIPKVVVDRKTYPDLFRELQLYEAPDVDDYTESLNLFSLHGLPLIIELYSKNNQYEEMKAMALEILQWFDPDDPFWKGDDDALSTNSLDHNAAEGDGNDEEDDGGTQSSADDSPSLEDLQQVLRTMEIKRKRILSRMLSESPTADCVNELNTVELHISRVEALITKLESESVGSGSSASSSGKQVVENHPHSLQSTNPNPISTGKNPTQTTKTTHKVAPMVQASPVPPQQASQTSVMLAQKNAGELNPPPLVPAMDLTALLQQQMLMNEMMMQQFGLSTRNASYPGQLSTPSVTPSFPTPVEGSAAQMLHGYGRGIPTAEQQQLQQLQMLQNQLMTGPGVSSAIPGLGENPLSQQQRELEAINLRLSALGMMPPATSGHPGSIPSFATAGQNMSSPSVPPGLMPSGMLGLPGVGRGKPAVGTFGSQPAGLQAMLQQQQQQQQPNFAFSALHQQQHSQRPQ